MKERLKKVVAWLLEKREASSKKSLANMLGYNPSSFSQILNGRVAVSDKFLNRLVVMEPRINIEWVKTGKGEMLLEKTMDDDLFLMDNGEELEFLTENTKGVRFYKRGDTLYMRVRHVPYAAFGQFANDADRLDPIEDDWSWEVYEVDHVARGNYLSFEVKGATPWIRGRGKVSRRETVSWSGNGSATAGALPLATRTIPSGWWSSGRACYSNRLSTRI